MFISKQKNKKLARFISSVVLLCLLTSILTPGGYIGSSSGKAKAADTKVQGPFNYDPAKGVSQNPFQGLVDLAKDSWKAVENWFNPVKSAPAGLGPNDWSNGVKNIVNNPEANARPLGPNNATEPASPQTNPSAPAQGANQQGSIATGSPANSNNQYFPEDNGARGEQNTIPLNSDASPVAGPAEGQKMAELEKGASGMIPGENGGSVNKIVAFIKEYSDYDAVRNLVTGSPAGLKIKSNDADNSSPLSVDGKKPEPYPTSDGVEFTYYPGENKMTFAFQNGHTYTATRVGVDEFGNGKYSIIGEDYDGNYYVYSKRGVTVLDPEGKDITDSMLGKKGFLENPFTWAKENIFGIEPEVPVLQEISEIINGISPAGGNFHPVVDFTGSVAYTDANPVPTPYNFGYTPENVESQKKWNEQVLPERDRLAIEAYQESIKNNPPEKLVPYTYKDTYKDVDGNEVTNEITIFNEGDAQIKYQDGRVLSISNNLDDPSKSMMNMYDPADDSIIIYKPNGTIATVLVDGTTVSQNLNDIPMALSNEVETKIANLSDKMTLKQLLTLVRNQNDAANGVNLNTVNSDDMMQRSVDKAFPDDPNSGGQAMNVSATQNKGLSGYLDSLNPFKSKTPDVAPSQEETAASSAFDDINASSKLSLLDKARIAWYNLKDGAGAIGDQLNFTKSSAPAETSPAQGDTAPKKTGLGDLLKGLTSKSTTGVPPQVQTGKQGDGCSDKMFISRWLCKPNPVKEYYEGGNTVQEGTDENGYKFKRTIYEYGGDEKITTIDGIEYGVTRDINGKPLLFMDGNGNSYTPDGTFVTNLSNGSVAYQNKSLDGAYGVPSDVVIVNTYGKQDYVPYAKFQEMLKNGDPLVAKPSLWERIFGEKTPEELLIADNQKPWLERFSNDPWKTLKETFGVKTTPAETLTPTPKAPIAEKPATPSSDNVGVADAQKALDDSKIYQAQIQAELNNVEKETEALIGAGPDLNNYYDTELSSLSQRKQDLEAELIESNAKVEELTINKNSIDQGSYSGEATASKVSWYEGAYNNYVKPVGGVIGDAYLYVKNKITGNNTSVPTTPEVAKNTTPASEATKDATLPDTKETPQSSGSNATLQTDPFTGEGYGKNVPLVPTSPQSTNTPAGENSIEKSVGNSNIIKSSDTKSTAPAIEQKMQEGVASQDATKDNTPATYKETSKAQTPENLQNDQNKEPTIVQQNESAIASGGTELKVETSGEPGTVELYQPDPSPSKIVMKVLPDGNTSTTEVYGTNTAEFIKDTNTGELLYAKATVNGYDTYVDSKTGKYVDLADPDTRMSTEGNPNFITYENSRTGAIATLNVETGEFSVQTTAESTTTPSTGSDVASYAASGVGIVAGLVGPGSTEDKIKNMVRGAVIGKAVDIGTSAVGQLFSSSSSAELSVAEGMFAGSDVGAGAIEIGAGAADAGAAGAGAAAGEAGAAAGAGAAEAGTSLGTTAAGSVPGIGILIAAGIGAATGGGVKGAASGAYSGTLVAVGGAVAGPWGAVVGAVLAAMPILGEKVFAPVLDNTLGKVDEQFVNVMTGGTGGARTPNRISTSDFLVSMHNGFAMATKAVGEDPTIITNKDSKGKNSYQGNAGYDELGNYNPDNPTSEFLGQIYYYAKYKDLLKQRGVDVDKEFAADVKKLEDAMAAAPAKAQKLQFDALVTAQSTSQLVSQGGEGVNYTTPQTATKDDVNLVGSHILGRDWKVDDSWFQQVSAQNPTATAADWAKMIKDTPEGKAASKKTELQDLTNPAPKLPAKRAETEFIGDNILPPANTSLPSELPSTIDQASAIGAALTGDPNWKMDPAWFAGHENENPAFFAAMIKNTIQGQNKSAEQLRQEAAQGVDISKPVNASTNTSTTTAVPAPATTAPAPAGDPNAWYNTWQLTDPNKQVADAIQMKLGRAPTAEELQKYTQGDMRASLRAIDGLAPTPAGGAAVGVATNAEQSAPISQPAAPPINNVISSDPTSLGVQMSNWDSISPEYANWSPGG